MPAGEESIPYSCAVALNEENGVGLSWVFFISRKHRGSRNVDAEVMKGPRRGRHPRGYMPLNSPV